jgi:hypothetical protein
MCKFYALKNFLIFIKHKNTCFRDCTTDITRTHHYGTPTEKEIV